VAGSVLRVPGYTALTMTHPPPARLRILLLEDEPAIADTLIFALERDQFEVHHMRLAREVLQAFAHTAYDLLILDVGVPDGNGLDVCRVVRQTSQVPIVFLTARDQEIDRVVGLEMGADDYIGKPFSPREVCARVRAILRRSKGPGHTAVAPAPPLPAAPVSVVGDALASGFLVDKDAQRIHFQHKILALTRYEFLLLKTLLERPNRIFGRAELMDRVWTDAPDTHDRTVDAHIKMLRAKLREAGADATCIETHRNMGYAFQLQGGG
jgi:two-component system catabolic regulation response regulator CreB